MRQLFITGGSSDIGVSVIRAFLNKNYQVIAQKFNSQPSFNELEMNTENLTSIKIDFSNYSNLERSIAKHTSLIEKSDVLVNAAAVFEPSKFYDISSAQILNALTINVIPSLILMKTIAPKMVERKWGRILNISSIGVKFGGGSNSFCYALSKHAMEFMPAIHKNWAAHNVLINTLRLGVVETRFHKTNPEKDLSLRTSLIPAGRMANTEEVAAMVEWLCSSKNSFTTGQTISMAGGE